MFGTVWYSVSMVELGELNSLYDSVWIIIIFTDWKAAVHPHSKILQGKVLR